VKASSHFSKHEPVLRYTRSLQAKVGSRLNPHAKERIDLNTPHFVLFGTYTELEPHASEPGLVKGIHVYRADDQYRLLESCQQVQASKNPSYLTVHPNGRFVYAVNEYEPEASGSGTVSAFSFDAQSGVLEFLNSQSSHGLDPCHLCVDRTEKFVIVANYSGGTICVLPILEDGTLGVACDVVQHHGSINASDPHPHAVMFDPSNRFLLVPDLGLDKLMVYEFDASTGTLEPGSEPVVVTAQGAGPRQLCLHPNGKFVYQINELNSTMTAYRFDLGALTKLETVSSLPVGFEGDNTGADVQVAPNGRFLFGSNRGHDSIVIFSIHTDGTLQLVGHQSTLGKNPRSFAISPNGEFLLVANQSSNTVVEFRIDHSTGVLTPSGIELEVSVPVCVRYV
jgi:6-phosphogluconolactonase